MSQLPRPNGPKSAGGAKAHGRFLLANVGMWLVMTAILVLLPDQLDRWMDLAIARAVGWAVAGSVWVVTIERHWQARMGALARFPLQVLLWASAAIAATWFSDLFRVGM
jgi:hypothetical protein